MPEEEETPSIDIQCLGKSHEFHSNSNHSPALSITSFGSYWHNEYGWNCHPGWQESPGHQRVRTVYPKDCLPKHPVEKCAGSGGKNCLQQGSNESCHGIPNETRQHTLCSRSTTHYLGFCLLLDKTDLCSKIPNLLRLGCGMEENNCKMLEL